MRDPEGNRLTRLGEMRECRQEPSRKDVAMNDRPAGDVTRLLLAWSGGDREALEKLLPLVYSELRRRAESQMRRERPQDTFQPTAPLPQADLKPLDPQGGAGEDKAPLFPGAPPPVRP